MKYSAKAIPTDYLSFPALVREKPIRSVWTAAVSQATASVQADETQVARGLLVAVPLSFALWVPLIWGATHLL